MIEVLAGLLALAGAAVFGPPSLIDTGVPSPTHDAGSFTEASAAFEARLRDLHPVGSEAAALRRVLLSDGFMIEAPASAEAVARLEQSGFLCLYDWTVRWTEDAGRIMALEGEHGGQCM